MTNKIFNKFKIENLLCFFIIICPILDVASFIFRNYFNTSLSISTILRPLIPIVAITYLFFKDKIKLPLIIGGVTYTLYGIIHLYIFTFLQTESSYGSLLREFQYIVNYTFMIMNLFIYLYVFAFKNECKEEKIKKLKLSILISFTLYIALMYIAILVGKSSYTYTEDKMGLKGWFESGNSVGAILLIMLFVILPMITKNNKFRLWVTIDIILAIIYLTILLGTRVGLFGSILVIGIFFIIKAINSLKNKNKINKKVVGTSMGLFFIIAILIISFGSNTISRRKLLLERENDIYDTSIAESSHVTGDILNLVQKIKNNEIEESYMSKPVQAAILNLYEFNNMHKVPYTNMRLTQLVYNISLIKEQKNILLILFGNGYMTHYYELIFEMEVPAFLFNFGIYGFILFFIPFLLIAGYGFISILRYIKTIKVEQIMPILALCFGITLSFLAGYTFFNQSAATIIIVMCVFTIYEIINMKGEKIEENNIWDNKSNTWRGRESVSRHSKQTSGKV